MLLLRLGLASLVLCFCLGCRGRENDRPIGPAVAITPPLGLPPVPIPKDNPPTAQTIQLGHELFYDKRLSANDTVACATCHDPRMGFADGLSRSRGMGGMNGTRNAPTIVNAAYLPLQFWDGRAISLEEQAAGPIANPVEMDAPHDVSLAKLSPHYTAMFAQSFGPGPIDLRRVENALASFERTVLSGNSAFDRYQFGGDKSALTPAQIRGLAVFTDRTRGNCVACHTIEKNYALFTDGKAHNTGEGYVDDDKFKDVGRFQQTGVKTDTGAFITPTLRNVADTGPYMHDGSLKTLKDVVDFYAGAGNSNPYLDKEMLAIHLTGSERADLVEFLQSLTGEMPANVGPPKKE